MKKLIITALTKEKALIIRTLLFLFCLVILSFGVSHWSDLKFTYLDIDVKNKVLYYIFELAPAWSCLLYVYLYFVLVAKCSNIREIIDDYNFMGNSYINKFPKYEEYLNNFFNSLFYLDTDKRGKTYFSYNWNTLMLLIITPLSICLASSSSHIFLAIMGMGSKTVKIYTTTIEKCKKIKINGRKDNPKDYYYYMNIRGKDYEISQSQYNDLITNKMYQITEKENRFVKFSIIEVTK